MCGQPCAAAAAAGEGCVAPSPRQHPRAPAARPRRSATCWGARPLPPCPACSLSTPTGQPQARRVAGGLTAGWRAPAVRELQRSRAGRPPADLLSCAMPPCQALPPTHCSLPDHPGRLLPANAGAGVWAGGPGWVTGAGQRRSAAPPMPGAGAAGRASARGPACVRCPAHPAL